MSQIPKVLLVMPCFNSENTIERALYTACNQTYSNFKLVCCDDCSTDNTLKILKEYQDIYGYSLIENKKNIGTGLTINKVVKEELDDSYDYLTWISSDNLLRNNFVEEHAKNLATCAVSFSNWAMFGRMSLNFEYDEVDFHKMLVDGYGIGPSFMFRRWVWKNLDHRPGEDWMFFVEAAIEKAKFGIVKKQLMAYRNHTNSVSGRLERKEIIEICSIDAQNLARTFIKWRNGNRIDG